jgi:hypothetical protein
MTGPLGLAAVTAVLKDLLDNGMIDHSVSDSVGGPVDVTALPPDRIKTGEQEKTQLNLFLYQVTPNAALRNADLPSRDRNGARLTNPPLALDLFYLLTAYGSDDFEGEILLGYAMQLLHETPVLSRDAIRRSLAAPTDVDGGILPPTVAALTAADLADQVEQIKLAPHPLNTEEMSKLWTAFQAKYRPSVAYQASVLLIESTLPTRSALPVLTRGEPDPATGRDRGVIVHASARPPFPALDAASPPDDQTAVRMGELLTLTGFRLEGDTVAARFTRLREGDFVELGAEAGATDHEFQVRMPPDPPAAPVPDASPLNPANWRAGVYAVEAIVRVAGEDDRHTNQIPVLLAPRLDSVAAAAAGSDVTVTVDVSPPVRRTQRVRLIVGNRELAPDAMAGESAQTLTFTSDAFASGSQWTRLRVDGVDSILVDRTASPPVFDASQSVTIP